MPQLQGAERAASHRTHPLGARPQAALATTGRCCLNRDAIAAGDWGAETHGADRVRRARGHRLQRGKVILAPDADDHDPDDSCVNDIRR